MRRMMEEDMRKMKEGKALFGRTIREISLRSSADLRRFAGNHPFFVRLNNQTGHAA